MSVDIRVRPRSAARASGRRSSGRPGTGPAPAAAKWLAIETKNVNAAACHFYQEMGCTLGAIDRFAYPGLPGEAQLVWWRGLAGPREP